MKFNDTAPVLAPADGLPLWLARLAENATLEATVLKRPVEGLADILSVIKHAVSLYEFQHHSYNLAGVVCESVPGNDGSNRPASCAS